MLFSHPLAVARRLEPKKEKGEVMRTPPKVHKRDANEPLPYRVVCQDGLGTNLVKSTRWNDVTCKLCLKKRKAKS